MTEASGVLGTIIERTRERVRESQARTPLDALLASIAPRGEERRSFEGAIRGPLGPRVIAEIKRRSPSRGALREGLDPAVIGASYEASGAAALSVLTEPEFFGGSLEDLERARGATRIPVLRKDFLVDRYQVWEARRAGADAALLIAAALDDAELRDLLAAASEAEIDALVEVHDREELLRALRAGARIIGVNNRDLRTLEVRLETSLRLAALIPDDLVAVAESGIQGADDARRLRDAGFDALLVGEHFMRAENAGRALRSLLEGAGEEPRGVRGARRVQVKICGVTTVDDALLAAEAGADLIGLVFWPGSRRLVDRGEARRICAALPAHVRRVGVFVDAPPEEVLRTADEVGLDVIQLHGSEPPEALDGHSRQVLKAVRVGGGFRPEDALRYRGRAAMILLDTAAPGAPGGTGLTFDWSRVTEAREQVPSLMLAGGLTAENVGAAIEALRPDAVDVSTGVEASPGRKDAAKVRAFIEAVRRASRAVSARAGAQVGAQASPQASAEAGPQVGAQAGPQASAQADAQAGPRAGAEPSEQATANKGEPR